MNNMHTYTLSFDWLDKEEMTTRSHLGPTVMPLQAYPTTLTFCASVAKG